MELFIKELTGTVTALTAIFVVLGRISHTKLARLEGVVTAAYSAQIKCLSVFGYCFIAIFPLLIASSLTEGDPWTDRAVFLALHALFFLMMLWTINNRIVIGRDTVGVSNLFGAIRIVPKSDMAAAITARRTVPVSATTFVGAGYKIAIDDDMQNCTEAVEALRTIVLQAAAR